MWQQVYNPLHSEILSTVAAAIPVVTLLVLIATGAVRTHIAAVIALVAAILVAVLLFTMPWGLAIRAAILGAITGFFPIGWIVLNVHLHVPADRRDRRLCGPAAGDRRRLGRPPPAAAPDRILVRRFLRGRFGLRDTRRGDRRDPDRARLLAARRLRPVADCQYRAGRLWRPRHTDRRACQRDGARPLPPRRDGRAAITVFLVDRAGLADLGLRGLAGHGAGIAGGAGERDLVRRAALPDLAFHQPLDRRYR